MALQSPLDCSVVVSSKIFHYQWHGIWFFALSVSQIKKWRDEEREKVK